MKSDHPEGVEVEGALCGVVGVDGAGEERSDDGPRGVGLVAGLG
jgi:hypothetical protein